MYEGALIAISEHPITGHGSNSARILSELIDNNEIRKIPKHNNFHSEHLQILVTQGVIGLSAFWAMLTIWVWVVRVPLFDRTISGENARSNAVAVLGLVVIVFFAGMVQINFDRVASASFFSFIAAILLAQTHRKNKE